MWNTFTKTNLFLKITENFTRCENAYADFRGVFYFGGEFNAVIMYIMMPKLDGIEAVKRISQKYGRDFIKQILHVRPKTATVVSVFIW